MRVLVLNSGSSSQKACLYEIGETLPKHPPACTWEGKVDFNGNTAAVVVKHSPGVVRKEQITFSSREQVVRHLLGTLVEARGLSPSFKIDVVGHRIVHGGPHFKDPVIVTPEVRSAITRVSELAPLHLRAELESMVLVDSILNAVPQVAVFDTGFHRQMPLAASVYPGPYSWFETGIHRYGFHGINHQYCASRAAQLLGEDPASLKLITCHLGNGCSLAAISGGRCVDTTMGFTPLDGLMMGTRSGSVDPGILIFLMRKSHLDAEQLDHMLNNESGLLGVSGLSSDLRDILAAIQNGNARAKLAFDIFVHRLQTAIGGMAAVLGGMDALVFTAGMGENSPDLRAAACSTLGFLGLKINSELNARPIGDTDIATADSRVRVLVIRAEEDWSIATECWKLTHTNPATTVPPPVRKDSGSLPPR